MPTCQNCQPRRSWWQTFKKTFSFRIGVACPFCNEKQYFSARFRIRSTMIPVIMSPFIIFTGTYFGFSYISLLIVLSILAVFFVVNPFFVELSKEEEPLF